MNRDRGRRPHPEGPPQGAHPVLSVQSVTKTFPGVTALDDVSIDFHAGQVHILFGENGAGKSTLVNLICGNYVPDSGQILVDGQPVHLGSPADAHGLGIRAVFQEFSLAPTMTVAQNVMIGQEETWHGYLRRRSIRAHAQAILDDLGFHVDVDARVDELSRSSQQMVEIAKALVGHQRIVVMDEPTAALTDHEAHELFRVVDTLRSRGLAIIYITHRMAEIGRVGDVVSVFRDGRHVADRAVSPGIEDELIRLMTGREILSIYPSIAFSPGQVRLALRGASSSRFQDVDIEVRSGEIVGLAGMAGCGKSDVAAACFGAFPVERCEGLEVDGRVVARPTPRRLIDQGIIYLPPDRHHQGLVMNRSVLENVSLSALGDRQLSARGWINRSGERRQVAGIVDSLDLRPRRIDSSVENFSGGNQQKVVFARALMHDTKVLIVDDPTVGVDVGVRSEIYERLKQMCESGVAVLLVSSDLNEILHLCRRAYVMANGRITASLEGADLTEEKALSAFFHEDRLEGVS